MKLPISPTDPSGGRRESPFGEMNVLKNKY